VSQCQDTQEPLVLVCNVAAYLLLVGFFVMERFVRSAGTKDMARTDHDRGTTTFVSVAMGTAFVVVPLGPLVNWLDIAPVHVVALAVTGVVMGLVGLFVRYLAFTTLGRFFTRTLRQAEDHVLVTDGIYRLVRHPGYLSDILLFTGAALATGNLIAMVVVPALFLPAYAYRIHTEEAMLAKTFGEEYEAYRRTSKRLVPFVF